MAVLIKLAFIAISLALGLGICTANRAVLDVAREENAAKQPPLTVFHEANGLSSVEAVTARSHVKRSLGVADLTEVAGKKSHPSKLNELGDDPFGGDGNPFGRDGNSPDYNNFPLSQWTGQALYCSPLACQGGSQDEYAGYCGGFSIYFDFDGPPPMPPQAAGPPTMPPRVTGIDQPTPANREQEDGNGNGILTDGNKENDSGATAPITGVAEPDPGK